VKRRVLAVALAVLLALIGIVAVLTYVHKANERAIAGLKAVTVLAASQPIPAGTSASAAQSGGLLTSEKLPLSSVPSGYLSSVTPDIAHLVTSSPMQPGQLLLRPMLVSAGHVTGTLAIPQNMMAVSVELCLQAEVAGYVQQGTHVAVFETYGAGGGQSLQQSCDATRQAQGGAKTYTRIVLPDVQVLSVAQGPGSSQGSTAGSGTVQVNAGASSPGAQGAVFVTFAVTPAQAQRLILVAQAGLPYLAMLGTNSAIAPTLAPAH
jgi:pilus assembly protein CpaB